MDHPKVRPLDAFPIVVEGQQVICLHDPTRINEKPLMVNVPTYFVLTLMDGTRDIIDIQTDFARRTGAILFKEKVESLIDQLDKAYLLENERFYTYMRSLQKEFLARPFRPCRHAGLSYPKDPDQLASMLDGLLNEYGEPGCDLGDEPPVGVIAPHIDFGRGAKAYGAAYGPLRRWAGDVDLYVILGTCHQGLDQGFSLTAKDYETPLGMAATDSHFVQLLDERTGHRWFEGEYAHRDEHSIEFQVLCLRHVTPRDRPLRVVPILCGSLQKPGQMEQTPEEEKNVRTFCSALREGIAETDARVCVVAGADLSHMGRRFGGLEQITPTFLSYLESRDRTTLEFVEQVDAAGFHGDVVSDGRQRNICGISAIYTLLETTTARRGHLLRYEQAVDDQTDSVVTFAAVWLVE